MNKIYLDDNIFYIEDFIDKDSIAVLQKEIEDGAVEVAEFKGLYHDIIRLNTPESQSVWDKIVYNLNDIFNNNEERLHDFALVPYLIKYVNREAKQTGWAMYPHADDGEYQSSLENYKPTIVKGIVIYITDDYEGGEIFYINKDIKIKPKSGYLVCHPGSEEYAHGVKSFSGGPRIVISAFVHRIQKPN
jgi:hypothetical protein